MKIAVIGSGIAGLTFAAAMHYVAPSINVALYERDAGETSRTQGYSIGLIGDAAIMVLKKLGLYVQLRTEMISITNFVFLDRQGKPLLELPTSADEKHWVCV